ncbi:MAG: ribonuclease G [Halofilum sp. (in: g-proteobacteria)]|nr:ribonuclease G [Halofilum sp. (in: g-proteobacteria)]
MSNEEILINVTPQESRVAMVENGVLVELAIERARRRGLIGNIYKGKVVRVLPGMEAAFVDLGLDRTAFLHVSDIAGSHKGARAEPVVDAEEAEGEGQPATAGPVPLANGYPPISELLHEGQELLVQVIKEPLGTKGARLTTHLTIPSRYIVLMPNDPSVGVSSKIEDEGERARLRSALEPQVDPQRGWGWILRTAAEGVSEEALASDMLLLEKLWTATCERATVATTGTVVHEDLPLPLRTLRDIVGRKVDRIRVDSEEMHQRMSRFAAQFLPEIADRVEHYRGDRPIFEIYGIEDEIQRALERKVQLKSGGYLIIDQTEAMTTIDVNTGAFVGHRNLEETIFKTNLEAAQAIARQLRLRNLGGIIIIDFIDMTEPEHRRKVLGALEKALEADHARTQVCNVSTLGLVEMTRKRTRESLEHVLCQPCPTCAGRGSIKSPETVCYEIFREILREARQFDARQLMVLAAQEVVDMLLDEESNSLAELEAFIGIPTRLQAEALYAPEQFDVVLV